MLLDAKGRLFGKVSIVDILVLLILAIVIGGLGYRYTRSSSVVLGKGDPVTIEFFIEETPTFAAEAIKEGDLTTDFQMGAVFGRVREFTIGEAITYGQNSVGEVVKSSREGYSSIQLVIEGEGFLSREGGVTINNVDYFIGHTTILRVGSAKIMGRVYDIKKRSNEL
jgi:hypothetical protein